MADDTRIEVVPREVFNKLASNMSSAVAWLPKLTADSIRRLGPIAVSRMRYAVLQNNYTGALSRSIEDDYSDRGLTVTVGPKALRGGKYDAGFLLEMGVPHPIPNVPYKTIAGWAAFKGAPMPGAWLAIRLRGIKQHPFLDNTLVSMQDDLTREAGELLIASADKVLSVEDWRDI